MSPRDVDRLSLAEFSTCMAGWRMVNGIKEQSEGFTEDELKGLGVVGFD